MRAPTFVFISLLLACSLLRAEQPAPVPIILDTDIMSDVDDAGAIAILHAMANRHEANILAIGVCVKNPWSPLCVDAMNTWFGRPEIPVGVVKGAGKDGKSRYAQQIAEEFPHALKSALDAPDATVLYRQILAKQPDKSVVMVSIGLLTNLQNLLKSGPDQYSPLGGVDLVKQKVKAYVCMGGKFPEGKEYNLIADGPAAAYTIANWPTPIVFSDWELGNKIMSGAALKSTPAGSPVRRAYELYNGLKNRQSWDLTAVLYAVRGLNGGLADYWDLHTAGHIVVNQDGSNSWDDSAPTGQHSYLVEKMPPAKIADVLNGLMLHPTAE